MRVLRLAHVHAHHPLRRPQLLQIVEGYRPPAGVRQRVVANLGAGWITWMASSSTR